MNDTLAEYTHTHLTENNVCFCYCHTYLWSHHVILGTQPPLTGLLVRIIISVINYKLGYQKQIKLKRKFVTHFFTRSSFVIYICFYLSLSPSASLYMIQFSVEIYLFIHIRTSFRSASIYKMITKIKLKEKNKMNKNHDT